LENSAVVNIEPGSLTLSRLGMAALGTLVAGSAWVDPAAAMAFPDARTVACRVMRQGRDIGRATTSFDRRGDDLRVTIAIDIRVRLGFITMFRYTHSNVEQWQGERLAGFEAHTNDDGTPNFATARWNGSGFDVTGSRTAAYVAPPEAIGTSYWNARTLTDPLINSQNGKLLDVRLTPLGQTPARLAAGRTVEATEYRMTGDMRMNLWYDAARNWAGLQYYAHDGSVLTYEEI
jgi:hypothetical protein